MLRRKFLIVFAPMVALMAATAVGAVWSLQKVLAELDHIHAHDWEVVEQVNALSAQVNRIELEVHRLAEGQQRHLDGLIEAVEVLVRLAGRIQRDEPLHTGDGASLAAFLDDHLPRFHDQVGMLATTEDPSLRQQRLEEFLDMAYRISERTIPLSQSVREHAREHQDGVLTRFRHIVLGLSLAFLLVINITVIILLRMAGIILRPMGKLVDATRRLGAGDFDCRVAIDQDDEFGQLAAAFNDLARRLGAAEQRRMEVLQQTARTLSHELNNCIAIIEMQLQLLQRRSGEQPEVEKRLREIRGGLERMTRTVAALQQVRRIVLTDYTPGVKMLDLEKSVQADADGDVPGRADIESGRATTPH